MNHLRLHERTLARRLRSVRRERFGDDGVPELAALLEIPPETWENYEAGVLVPATILLAFIAETGVSPHWLLTGKAPKYSTEGDGTR